MKKFKKVTFALAAAATTALSGCSLGKKDVEFWSCFGTGYSNLLTPIVDDIASELKLTIHHTSKDAYDLIHDAMQTAIASGKYPGIAVGYPDHFADYQGAGILLPLDEYAKDIVSDYDQNYMKENYLYDQDGSPHLYGLPFNKSTELLGYNGVFVDYCAWKYSDKSLLTPPATWGEWNDIGNENSKVYKYMETFRDLIDNNKKLYATLDASGNASNFSETSGERLVLDYSGYTASDKKLPKLMTWDATDNAFITLVRQWGGQYTELPESERSVNPLRRKGSVLFANSANLNNTVNMLKFFSNLHNKGYFGYPKDFGSSYEYSTDPFKAGKVMFVICSSGGMAHNTGMWNQRFRTAPIPYKEESKKYVISQGANICLTKSGNAKNNFAVMKALTTGKYQTRWAIDTGYFPASSSSEQDQSYKDFLARTDYNDELAVYKREGAQTNTVHYSNAEEHWQRFVDDAFIGSSEVRKVAKTIFPLIFAAVTTTNVDDTSVYTNKLKDILNQDDFKGNDNLSLDLAPEVSK